MPSTKRIISDLRVFGRGYFRNAAGLFFGLIFPVILILIFGAIFQSGLSGTITLCVQNHDTGPYSTPFMAAINGAGTVNLVNVSTSENFSQYLSAHSASDGIIIPADFSANYAAGQPVNVTLYGNPTSTTNGIVEGVTASVLNSFNLARTKGVPVLGLQTLSVASKSYKYIDFLVPGLIGFAVLTSPMFALVNVSSTYKRDKIFKALTLTPLTKAEWLLSKIIWYI